MKPATKTEKKECTACGMHVENYANYHPYLACVAFKQLRDGLQVEDNLRAVIEYGMKAQEMGITAEQALKDIKLVHVNSTKKTEKDK